MEYSFINDEINNILNGVINFINIEVLRNNWYIYIDYFNLNVIMTTTVPFIMIIGTLYMLYYFMIFTIYYTFKLFYQYYQILHLLYAM
jgi:hypothetical protein